MYEFFPLRRVQPPQPMQTFDDAIARVQQIQEAEATAVGHEALHPNCHTLCLTHETMTEHVLVLIHGFTNCPYQYHMLAEALHTQGHSVLAVRLPAHGHADRMTTTLAEMKTSDLLNSVMKAVDIAQGLGKNVSVVGFSLGGILAAWLGERRTGLHQIILISPAIGVQAVTPRRRRWAALLLEVLPNSFYWWDPERENEAVEPLHAYPRFATHSMGVLLRLGVIVVDHARRNRPVINRVTYIANPSDPVVDFETTEWLLTAWEKRGVMVTRHTFPAEWDLLHDLVDPLQPEAQIERVYPLLVEWIEVSLR